MTIPGFAELRACAHVVSIPLVTPFRGLHHREAIIFDGLSSPAEWSPFPEYDDAEAARWLRGALEQGWSAPVTANGATSIRVNGTIPAVSPEEATALIVAAGFPHTVKIKVAGPSSSLADDQARVEAVRKALGATGRIRLDANGAWNLDEAEHAIRTMEHCDIDYVEQPVEKLADMAELRTRMSELGIGVAADESVRRWSDLDAIIESRAADIVVIKIQPLGGVSASRILIDKALNAGLEVVLSSALETSVGLFPAALLQASLERENPSALDAGLATASFLSRDVVTQPLIAHAGELTISPPTLDYSALEELGASPERTTWWLSRLERCLALV